MTKVLIFNGGRGAGSLISQTKQINSFDVTSIVNAYDDGKSTGEIRRFFSMLGPSDIRKVQELFIKEDRFLEEHKALFQFRYPVNVINEDAKSDIKNFASSKSNTLGGIPINNPYVRDNLQIISNVFLDALSLIERSSNKAFSFSDCSIMNCLYAGSYIYNSRNIEKASSYFYDIFALTNKVIPNSLENKILVGLRENGQMLYSEAEIVELRSNVKIDRIYLLDNPPNKEFFDSLTFEEKKNYLEIHDSYVEITESASRAIKDSDIIIYAPGTQHSSLYPTYFTKGVSEAIKKSNALKVFVTNIGADYETPTYKASDYIKGAFRYLSVFNKDDSLKDFFDINLVNESSNKSSDSYVEIDKSVLKDTMIDTRFDNFEMEKSPGKHDGAKVINHILDIYKS